VVTDADIQFPVRSECENTTIVFGSIVHARYDEDLRRPDPCPCRIDVTLHDPEPIHGAHVIDEDIRCVGICRVESDPEQTLFSFIVDGDGDEGFGSQRAIEQAYSSAVLLGEEEFSVPTLNDRNARRILGIRCACERIDPVLLLRERWCREDENEEEEYRPE